MDLFVMKTLLKHLMNTPLSGVGKLSFLALINKCCHFMIRI